MPTTTYRYQLPKKAIKTDCPDCGPKHRRTLSRYVDTQTGEPLPEVYGRCDRESNCGYHLSPYQKTQGGVSYADAVYEQWKRDHEQTPPVAGRRSQPQPVSAGSGETVMALHPPAIKPTPTTSAPKPGTVWSIPDSLFRQTLGHYDKNQFAHLLREHFGAGVAEELLERFHIGTSARWPGANVFWYIDEQGRKRGGQIKLFGDDWHTVKYVDREGRKRTKTSWVHSAYAYRCDEQQQPRPEWLTAYIEQHEFSPCLFGLPQLSAASVDQPVAIVEAPKTAVLCTPYFPEFIWLAVGALSYLNQERLAPLRGRTVMLFPDLSLDGSAFRRWSAKADQLQKQGFQIEVSRLLEDNATDAQRAGGGDLADCLLEQWPGYPIDWDWYVRRPAGAQRSQTTYKT